MTGDPQRLAAALVVLPAASLVVVRVLRLPLFWHHLQFEFVSCHCMVPPPRVLPTLQIDLLGGVVFAYLPCC